MLDDFEKNVLKKATRITRYVYKEDRDSLSSAIEDLIDEYHKLQEDEEPYRIPSDYELDQEFMEMNRMC